MKKSAYGKKNRKSANGNENGKLHKAGKTGSNKEE